MNESLLCRTALPQTVRVLANGSALFEGYGRGAAYAPDRWCGDWAELRGGARVENALFCQPTASADADAPAARSLLYGALFAVSAVFLLLTLVVYLLLPELRRSASAKALLCHVAALMVGSLALASGQLRAVVADDECYLMGFIIQYMMLATFFWLNVLCFDIATAVKWGEQRLAARSRHVFLWYSLYAWGVPALITAVTVALQFLEDLPDTIVLPDIGVSTCWFHTAAAGWAYFYGPLAVLLGANALLAAAAAAQMLRGRRTRSLLRAAGVACALFVLSGVSWLCEVASFADGSDSLVWTVMDVVNILRGLFVFVLLCCRPKVGRLLRRRLCGGTTVGEVDDCSSGAGTSVYSALQMETVPSACEAPQHPTPNGTGPRHT
ncbi:G-protein coupled receptor Mth2 [Gryllus bimaculatus]|nr:G-protein coupled receptor Mth2 [Gryllus bimaculatus]